MNSLLLNNWVTAANKMVGPTFFHSLQFVTKWIITAFFKKRERERVDKQTLNSLYFHWGNLLNQFRRNVRVSQANHEQIVEKKTLTELASPHTTFATPDYISQSISISGQLSVHYLLEHQGSCYLHWATKGEVSSQVSVLLQKTSRKELSHSFHQW